MNELDTLLEEAKKRVINLAIERKIITREEWNNKFKGKYIDQYGIDSFIHYLEATIFKMNGFVTLNEKIIKDKKELEKRFKIKIIGPKEMKGMVKKNKHKNDNK